MAFFEYYKGIHWGKHKECGIWFGPIWRLRFIWYCWDLWYPCFYLALGRLRIRLDGDCFEATVEG